VVTEQPMARGGEGQPALVDPASAIVRVNHLDVSPAVATGTGREPGMIDRSGRPAAERREVRLAAVVAETRRTRVPRLDRSQRAGRREGTEGAQDQHLDRLELINAPGADLDLQADGVLGLGFPEGLDGQVAPARRLVNRL